MKVGLICYENPRVRFLWDTQNASTPSGQTEDVSFKNMAMDKYASRNWFYKDLETLNF